MLEKIIFIFIFLVTVNGNAQQCREEKYQDCLKTLFKAIKLDQTETEACRELEGALDCMQAASEVCRGLQEESEAAAEEEEIDEGLRELEDFLAKNCLDLSVMADATKECLKSTEDELLECVGLGMSQVLESALGLDELDENEAMCSMYTKSMECMSDRVEDKCGEEAGKELDEAFYVPVEIFNICFINNTDSSEEPKAKKKK